MLTPILMIFGGDNDVTREVEEIAAVTLRELLLELAQLPWLHPIAADLFRRRDKPAAANGSAPGFDVDAVRTRARRVARVLHPVARKRGSLRFMAKGRLDYLQPPLLLPL